MNKTIRNSAYTLNMMKTTQFKSTRIHISFGNAFDVETVTQRALLPYIMKAASINYPKRSSIVKYLEHLYSAYFTASVEKIGKTHLVFFDMSVIDDHYTLHQENLFEQAILFMKEIIYNPLFDQAHFDEEKRLLKEYFEGIYSNKFSYAVKLLNKHMFKDETYRIGSLGDETFVDPLTIEDVLVEYQKMLQNDMITITVVGDIDFDHVEHIISSHFDFNNRSINLDFYDFETKEIKEVEDVVVKQEITQAKYSMGYRIPIYYDDPLYDAMLVLNTMLGGTSESLLHQKIREELGLCYYIGSNYSSHKGVLFIHSGIDQTKKDIVYEETLKIIDNIIDQDYDDMYLDMAKKSNIASIIESKDSATSLTIRLERMSFYDKELDFDKKIKGIDAVTKDHLSNIAKLMTLDTTLLMRGDE